ncbi:MAG TPA: hypothetical protein VMU21_07220 [Thermodesulfovibrionales bacterium]|nr:hypothetical protein [Thermodesulfovibrionales bacterium]HVO64947.1 hypothetical protein [Syntrophales bacterium]
METTLYNKEMLTDTSSVLLGTLGVDEISLTPVNISRFKRLDEWGNMILIFPSWEHSQPKVDVKMVLPLRLTDPLYGREELNHKLQEMATGAPSVEQVWEITKRLPSLSRLLSEERDNE